MTRKHFCALCCGIVFWVLLYAATDPSPSRRLSVPEMLWAVGMTAVLTFGIQAYLEGFPVTRPIVWFFYPLASWLVLRLLAPLGF